jgi:phosphohistidine phosphatase
LTPEGVEKTERVAKAVAKLVSSPDRMLSSPFTRAMQTAEIFAAALGWPKQEIVRTDALLPASDPAALFRELAKLKDAEEVFCFGHAPHVDEALAFAVGSNRSLTVMKKSGLACLELEHLSPPKGILLWFCPPKIMRRL